MIKTDQSDSIESRSIRLGSCSLNPRVRGHSKELTKSFLTLITALSAELIVGALQLFLSGGKDFSPRLRRGIC
jgi:hypothetical protein